MLRVRRSSIRPIADDSALACFLSVSLDASAAPTRGFAAIRPPLDLAECQQAAEQAARLATEIRAGSVFDFWVQLRDALKYWEDTNEKSAEVVAYGLALVERALVDACCREWERPFTDVLRENALRIDLGKLCKPLSGCAPKKLLPAPSNQIQLSYGFGVDSQLEAEGGLTRALESGMRGIHFGLSGSGSEAADLARMVSVAEQMGKHPGRYVVSLGGNGSYDEPGHLRTLVQMMHDEPALKTFCRSLSHIEQPFSVDASLSNAAVALFAEWPDRPPILVDESAAAPGGCVRALEWGYAGAVYRAERGLIPGIVDACLLGARQDREPVGKWTLAAALTPDLPPAILPELAIYSALGLQMVTAPASLFRAYTGGLPEAWRNALAVNHPDTFNADLSLKTQGSLNLDTEINRAPLGSLVELDPTALI